jgi:hypothetical protein
MRPVAYGRSLGFVALVIAVACSASEESNPPRGSTGDGATSNGGTIDIGDGGEGASTSTAARGGTSSVGLGGAGDPPLGFGGACAAEITKGEIIPLDVHIMLDTSLSMLDATGFGTNKWDDVKEALELFLTDPSSDGIGVGIQFFPLQAEGVPTSCMTDDECGTAAPCDSMICANSQTVRYCTGNSSCGPFGPCVDIAYCSGNPLWVCSFPGEACLPDDFGNDLGVCTTAGAGQCRGNSSCAVGDYSAPAEPVQVLPDGAQTILDAINAKDPFGNTPTAAALAGALGYASTWAQDNPTHTVVTLLATDGFPTQCAPTDFPAIAAIAGAAHDATPSIGTYVVGVFPPGTPMVQENLDLIADAGGTEHAYIIDTTQGVAEQFLAALNSIRGSKLACEFQVPLPPDGEELDYDGKVNVQFSAAGTAEVLPYVASADNCGVTQGGWYYDLDPSSGGVPTKILVCPSTCDAFQNTADGQVEIALGCETVTTIVK